jgi:dipeptidyl aminopeptidase/acylaminoacyl peptidase
VDENAPVLLIATGGSNRGSLSPSWVNLPHIYKAHGISTIIFDFAGQGLSQGNRRYLTINKGVQNLVDILKFILKWGWIQKQRIALMGSSFGGNVVLDYLASDEALAVRGAVFKSPCIDLRESYFQELGDEGMRKWQKEGYSDLTGLAWEVIEDADASDLPTRLNKIKVPILITHGCSDESVPIAQSRRVRDGINGIVDLVEMKGTNHHYSDRDDWDRMVAIHVGWVKHLFFNIKGDLK